MNLVLDALDPTYLDRLISRHINAVVDQEAWDRSIKKEEAEKIALRGVANNWRGVIGFLGL
jgi:hypothetical protein